MLLINDRVAEVKSKSRLVETFARTIPAPALVRPTPSAPVRESLRSVMLLIETSGSYGRGLLQGIARYNREHSNWSTCVRPQGMSEPAPAWLESWSGDGMLVRVAAPDVLDTALRSSAAVVNLRATQAGKAVPTITVDNAQVAQLAAQHLQERGFEHFAFCGRGRASNSVFDERRECFRKAIEKMGRTCFVFEPADPASAFDWEAQQDELAKWIASLPKPIGIMACNDERGLQVLDAARRCGVTVPDDAAVIGVDNDQPLCELSIPPLSSIDVNAEGIGYEAAKLLDRMMNGEKVANKPIVLSPRGVVARRSTDVAASEDEDISRAVRYIREHACSRLQVTDVLDFLGMSRASLQQRMKQLAGRTIHQEIQRVRLAKVKELLAMSRLTIKQVARESGFASVQYMTRVFRAATGETPAVYRKKRT